MPELVQNRARGRAADPLILGEYPERAIVNLRGDATNPVFAAAVRDVLGLALPTEPCTTAFDARLRIVWAGPDDWFVIGAAGSEDAVVAALHAALHGCQHAVTDVSSGYCVVQLAGPQARDVLAQGCPLDLHPRVHRIGMASGSHFFKASIWLWLVDEAPTFELLIRSSFVGYFDRLLADATIECGMVRRVFS